MKYGIGNIKNIDKSKSLFTTSTAPTESGGVITLAITDIVESGFKVGDYLAYVDSGNISALYSISAISSGTATLSLIGNIGEVGGGSQLYQHNVSLYYQDFDLFLTIVSSKSTALTKNDIKAMLGSSKYLQATGQCFISSNRYSIFGIRLDTTNNVVAFTLQFTSGSRSHNTSINTLFSGATLTDNIVTI